MAKKKSKRANGEGCIYRRTDGKWCGVVTVGRDQNTGKLRRRSIYGKTREEVSRKMTQVQYELNQGTYVETNKLKVSEWFETWLKEYVKTGNRAATYKSYEEQYRLHIKPAIGSLELQKLQPVHLQKLYNDLVSNGRTDGQGGLSPKTVHMIHGIIHSALEQALKESRVIRNVSEATKLPRMERKDPKAFKAQEQDQFLSALGENRLRAVFILALGSGLRVGELLGLKWRDIDLDQKLVSVKQALGRVKLDDDTTILQLQGLKTEKSRRTIPLPEAVVAELKRHKEAQESEISVAGQGYKSQDLVFCTELGEPISPRNLTRQFHQLQSNAGMERLNLHGLRHSYATRMLEQNEHPKTVSELLGHSNIAMTMDLYSHVFLDVKEAAASRINHTLITENPSKKEGLL